MSIETLSIPLLYGQPVGITVFSTFLYKNGLQSINPDYGILGAASTLILLVTVLLVALSRPSCSRMRNGSYPSEARRPDRAWLELGWIKWARDLLHLGLPHLRRPDPSRRPRIPVVHSMFFTPLANPFEFLTLANYERIFGFPVYVQSIQNSLIVAGVGAVVVSIIATVAVVVARRSSFRLRKLIEYLALATASHARPDHRYRPVLGDRAPPVRTGRRNPGHPRRD